MNHFKKITYLFLACIGLTLIAPGCKSGGSKDSSGGDLVSLKLNFKAGDKFLYSTHVDQKIESVAAVNQNVVMDMIYACTGDEGGNKKLSITYDYISMKMSSPMGSASYDSRDPSKSDMSMTMADSLIGKSFSVFVSPDGQIKKVDGLAELINTLNKRGDKKAGAEAASAFSDTAVMQLMQASFGMYPDHPVKVGEQWVKKSQTGFSGINVDVESTYTLTTVEGNKAVISMNAVMSLPKSDMGPTGSGMQLEMKGTQQGTLDVDIPTGQIISGKTKQDIKGTMTVPGMGQPMPMNIKGDITLITKKL